jgi:hypothetical protein
MDCPVSVKEYTYQLSLIFTIITCIYSRRMEENLLSSSQGGDEIPRKAYSKFRGCLNSGGLPITFSGVIMNVSRNERAT